MQLRQLVVAQRVYRWRSSSRLLPVYSTSPHAVEVVIYQEGCRSAPLRLVFKEDDNVLLTDNSEPGRWLLHEAGAGIGWFDTGLPLALGETRPTVNFNRPVVVVRLLEFFLSAGWEPASGSRPFEVGDALKYLNVLDLPRLAGS
jgi:hypothetical protein